MFQGKLVLQTDGRTDARAMTVAVLDITKFTQIVIILRSNYSPESYIIFLCWGNSQPQN